MKTLLVWLLAPLTAVQGLWLRRRATRLPGAPGNRSGRVGSGPEIHLLAIGDSIIDGVGTPTMEAALPALLAQSVSSRFERTVHWRAEGKSGLAIDELLRLVDGLDQPRADLVLVSVGVNDVTGLTTLSHWRRQVDRLLDSLTARWPGVRIVFAGLPPMEHFPLLPQPLRFTLGWRAAALDRVAAQVCSVRSDALHVATRVDPSIHTFAEDGYHPSSESCRQWAEELAVLIRLPVSPGHPGTVH